MSLRQRFYFALIVAVIIITIHTIAVDLYLYWIYRWVDTPMHILGGFMSGLFALVLMRFMKWPETIGNVIIGVLLVGLGWEVLELFYRAMALGPLYRIDTFKDLVNDVIGGLLAIYTWKKIPTIQN